MELPGRRLATTHDRAARPILASPIEVPARFQLLVDGPGDGAWNMAVDEALMCAARAGSPTLRFYTWEPDCLSLGRNQSTPVRIRGRSRDEFRPGDEVVRRPTGGRSVYHSRELTYSLTVPDRLWGGPRRLYRRVNRALRRGLISLGASLDPDPAAGPVDDLDSSDLERGGQPGGAHAASASRTALGPWPCFQAPAPGEVTAGGRKLVGSAQWRHAGAVLQHGSILLQNEQGLGDLRATAAGTDEEAEPAAIGLGEIVPELPEPGHLIRALTDAFLDEFALRPDLAARAAAIEAEAHRLVAEKYRTREWTWRR